MVPLDMMARVAWTAIKAGFQPLVDALIALGKVAWASLSDGMRPVVTALEDLTKIAWEKLAAGLRPLLAPAKSLSEVLWERLTFGLKAMVQPLWNLARTSLSRVGIDLGKIGAEFAHLFGLDMLGAGTRIAALTVGLRGLFGLILRVATGPVGVFLQTLFASSETNANEHKDLLALGHDYQGQPTGGVPNADPAGSWVKAQEQALNNWWFGNSKGDTATHGAPAIGARGQMVGPTDLTATEIGKAMRDGLNGMSVQLNGQEIGKIVTGYMSREAARPPASVSNPDPRHVLFYPGSGS
jgi:hypothetical protein